ncbi:M16 family metallopeptidase [Fuscibacter oryzae]|uniref:Insulinase family protein n=1 Tax=Fuscibacter oryzae TaxID=2803939 RepID=A0A8J7MSB4_9RHOB|nr:pitrilysin family protein [Fuscibacter oryzae]MBL4929622.1 insulinase family protein [Fuscibacter oryzae]
MISLLRTTLALLALALPLNAEIAIKEVTSPGGIKAWLVEDHSIPFTALELRFKGGTSLDDPAKRGAVNLMTATLEEGAGAMDAQGFAAARDGLATKISFGSDADGVSVSAQFLTEKRDASVTLLREALVNPRFDQDAVDRVKGQVLANLRASAEDSGKIAGELLSARSFGSHPYGSTGDGTIDSVTALTRDDVVAAWKAAIARDRIYVSAAGDISPEDLGKLLDRLLADLPATGAPQPGDATFNDAGGVKLQPFPGPTSVVLFQQGGIKFTDPDYFAAVLLNEILGGGRFSARLMTEVREKRGLTYGIGTSLASYDHAETLVGQFQASNEKVAEAIKVIQDQWAKVAKEGVTEDELDRAKTYMTGAYPLRFDGNSNIASILVGMQMMGLTPDYPRTRNDRVNAVTLADVKRVAARLIKPENLFFMVVGTPTNLKTTE